jgi:hypothetical protein
MKFVVEARGIYREDEGPRVKTPQCITSTTSEEEL